MPTARKPASARRGRRASPRSAPSVPELPPGPRIELHEPPHAHIVCRGCGRIASVELQPEEGQQLISLADRSPAGWAVGGIAYSLTGVCASCRATGRA